MAFKVFGKQLIKEENKQSTDNPIEDSTLTEQELNFILTKLRSAQYTGAEFEIFYSVWMKLLQIKVK